MEVRYFLIATILATVIASVVGYSLSEKGVKGEEYYNDDIFKIE